jgi:hypothetical protein
VNGHQTSACTSMTFVGVRVATELTVERVM